MSTAPATCTSTATTRSRTWASRWARGRGGAWGGGGERGEEGRGKEWGGGGGEQGGGGGGGGHGRQKRHLPLRPGLCAAGRGALARGGRYLGPPGAAPAYPVQRRPHWRLRHPTDLRILPGLREPRGHHAAHRQPQGRQRAPPVRVRVQGLCPRAARGARTRPPLGGPHRLDQRLFVKCCEPC